MKDIYFEGSWQVLQTNPYNDIWSSFCKQTILLEKVFICFYDCNWRGSFPLQRSTE